MVQEDRRPPLFLFLPVVLLFVVAWLGNRPVSAQSSAPSSVDRDTSLPETALRRLGKRTLFHPAGVLGVSVSTGSGLIASVDKQGRLEIWALDSGEHIRTLLKRDGFDTVDFSADGRRVVVGTHGGDVLVVNVRSGEVEMERTASNRRMFAARFSNDGSLVAAGGRNHTLNIWNVETGEELRSYDVSKTVWSIAFSPEARFVAASIGDEVYVWNRASGEQLQKFSHGNAAGGIAFSPDGERVAAGGASGRVRVWNLSSGDQVHSFSEHEGPVFHVSFHPDGKRLYSAGEDQVVRVWDLEKEKEMKTFPDFQSTIWVLDLSSDGRYLVAGLGDGRVRRINLEEGTVFEPDVAHRGQVTALRSGPSGQILYSGGAGGHLVSWNLRSGEPVEVRDAHPSGIRDVSMSPDGSTLVSCGSESVRFWKGPALKPVRTWKRTEVKRIAHAPDSSVLGLAASDDLLLMEVPERNVIHRLEHDEVLRAFAFAPNRPRVITATHDGTFVVWNRKTGGRIRAFRAKGESPELLDFDVSPMGSVMAGVFEDRPITLWNYRTGRVLQVYDFSKGSSVAFTGSGLDLLIGTNEGRVQVRSVHSGDSVASMSAGIAVNRITTARFRMAFATGLADSTVLLWSLDGRIFSSEKRTGSADRCWTMLASEKPILRYQASLWITRFESSEFSRFRTRVEKALKIDEEAVQKQIERLSNSSYEVRKNAYRKLKNGLAIRYRPILDRLKKAYKQTKHPEARLQMRRLVKVAGQEGPLLKRSALHRMARLIEGLRHRGGKAARSILRTLARTAGKSYIGRMARTVLEELPASKDE